MQRLTGLSSSIISVVVLAAAGCGDDGGDPGVDAPMAEAVTAYAVSGDFASTGVFTSIDVAAGTVTPNALAGVAGGDPFLRRAGDEIMIINRDAGENVTVLGGKPLALVDQFGTGAGSNPQDVASVGGKLYVPALGTAGVVVVNRATRAITTITIDGDPDAKPDCISAYAVGTQVYVVCGLLDATFTARGNGKVAVIDTATDTVTASFDLADRNPIGLLARMPNDGDLIIGTAPSFSDFSTGCVARIRTGATPTANGCLVTNQVLEGLANHLDAPADGELVWIAVTGFSPDFTTQFGRLRAVDTVAGTPWPVSSGASQRIDDVTACADGYVVGADGTMGASGVRIWKDNVEVTTAALDIGRPTAFGNNLICR